MAIDFDEFYMMCAFNRSEKGIWTLKTKKHNMFKKCHQYLGRKKKQFENKKKKKINRFYSSLLSRTVTGIEYRDIMLNPNICEQILNIEVYLNT